MQILKYGQYQESYVSNQSLSQKLRDLADQIDQYKIDIDYVKVSKQLESLYKEVLEMERDFDDLREPASAKLSGLEKPLRFLLNELGFIYNLKVAGIKDVWFYSPNVEFLSIHKQGSDTILGTLIYPSFSKIDSIIVQNVGFTSIHDPLKILQKTAISTKQPLGKIRDLIKRFRNTVTQLNKGR